MAQAENQQAQRSSKSILDRIGTVTFDPRTNFFRPYDNDDENEIWLRQRAVLLRNVFERYPSHDAALACLAQFSHLELEQPFLAAKTNDDLDEEEFKITGLYRRFDVNNRKHLSEWQSAVVPIYKRHDARAARILSENPELGLSEWAHQRLIRSHGMKLLDNKGRNIKKVVGLIDELSETIERYVRFRLNENSSIEPFEGYFNIGSLQAGDFLVHAVHALAPKGRAAQLALLNKAAEMFPDNEQVKSCSYKFNSFEETFELSFTDLVSGASTDIKDYRGKVVIIDFWAVWCQPCLSFVPYLKKVASKHPDDVKIIGISCDDAGFSDQATDEQRSKLESMVVDCATKHGMDWPIFLGAEFHQKWCITGIPTIFVVDRRGVLRSLDARATLAKTVRQLLKEQ
ncbi:MAG: TlpA family protein disulfide reductase [Gammaproteobacteria bacterium]|nr:TlpA family protein disulfide reductase [Gammaproteobacteria bacterium]MYD79618.1 TlpA family protein disulfide reductase [Gammaproteobacteria bacterium]